MIDFSIPLAGMQRAVASLDQTAKRLAKDPSAQGDTVELSAEVVAMLEAKNNFKANANVLRTEDDLTRSLLDVLG